MLIGDTAQNRLQSLNSVSAVFLLGANCIATKQNVWHIFIAAIKRSPTIHCETSNSKQGLYSNILHSFATAQINDCVDINRINKVNRMNSIFLLFF